MVEKILDILKSGDVEIVFKSRVPYLCNSTNEDYGVGAKASIGDNTITGYNTVDQKLMDSIKYELIKILENKL